MNVDDWAKGINFQKFWSIIISVITGYVKPHRLLLLASHHTTLKTSVKPTIPVMKLMKQIAKIVKIM